MIEFFSRLGLRGRRWYFRVKGRNGEVLCQSEAYNSRESRSKGLLALQFIFLSALPDQGDSSTRLSIKDLDAKAS